MIEITDKKAGMAGWCVKKMVIEVCSREKAIELTRQASVKTSIISIVSREETDVMFPENPNILSVLRMKFNDLAEEYDAEGIPYGRPLPQLEDFRELKSFVLNMQCDLLIIHCYEGRSRSAAIAKAIYEFRHESDEFRIQVGISPNPLVYALACHVLEEK